MKQRIEYIDIAKALLILCLLYGHMFMIARFQGYNDNVNTFAKSFVRLYATFFMQSFFIITGLCSSFNTDFKPFLWKNTKTILIPGITLTILNRYLYNLLPGNPFEYTPSVIEWFIDGGPWFIIALFSCKIIYWFIYKLKIKKQLILVGGGYLLGLMICSFFGTPNYLCYQHTLLMLPYLCIGCLAKQYIDRINHVIPIIGLVGIAVLIIEFVFELPMPIHDYSIGVSIKSFPLHIVNVLMGTAFIFWISKLININSFMQLIGEGTLIIYLLNECILKAIINLLSPIYCATNTASLVLFYSLVYVLLVLSFVVLIKLIYSSKYLSWIVGKY